MNTMRTVFFLPFLLLSACSRQPVQQTAQPGAQTAAGQAAQPPSGQTAPAPAGAPVPPASAPTPPVTGEPAPDESASTAAQQAPRAATQPAPPSPAGSQVAPSAIRIPSGTVWRVRLEETLDTRRNRPGDRFSAALIQPIRVQGDVVVPSGTHCSGHLVESSHPDA